jgi:hypothetical protein
MFYRQKGEGSIKRLGSVNVSTRGPSFEFGKPSSHPFENVEMYPIDTDCDVTPDGQHFVMLVPAADSSAKPPPPARPQIKIITNWF